MFDILSKITQACKEEKYNLREEILINQNWPKQAQMLELIDMDIKTVIITICSKG